MSATEVLVHELRAAGLGEPDRYGEFAAFRCPRCHEHTSTRCVPALDTWRCSCGAGGRASQLARSLGHRNGTAPVVPTAGNTGITGITGITGLISMEDVAAEAVRWVWPPRIALGKVTVLEGDPDQGKSLMTVDLAARLSRGDGMPDGATGDVGGPAATLLLTAEDGLADTVRPRLEAAGAVVGRVHVLESVPGDDGEPRAPELPRDIPHLRDAIVQVKAGLVVIDVLMAYLGADVKALADQDIRRALRPLAKLAEELNVAMVVLRHLTKGGGANPLYRGGGAVGLGAAARSVLLAGNDPKVPGRHLLARVKGNLAAPYPTLGYEILTDLQNRPFIRWLGPSSTTAVEMLTSAAEAARDASDDTSAEGMFLEDVLAGGERSAKDITAAAEKHGLKYRAVWRASQRLGITRRQVGFGADCQWLWSLPAVSDSSDDSDDSDSEGRNHSGNTVAEDHLPPRRVP